MRFPFSSRQSRSRSDLSFGRTYTGNAMPFDPNNPGLLPEPTDFDQLTLSGNGHSSGVVSGHPTGNGNGNGNGNGSGRIELPKTVQPTGLPTLCPADLTDPLLSQNAITVLERRYLEKDENGKVCESPRQMFWRVARTIASNETKYRPDLDVVAEARAYYNYMASLDFLPNSPTLMNAGRPLGQLAACFVLPVDDTMEGIFDAVKHAALVHKSGGGTGFSFSRLRPKSSMVASTAGTASGPVSFMTVFNAATETIKQGGTRRGANMGILRVDHPDIRDFITCKRDMVSVTNFNISVAVTDKFMEAVETGANYDLIAPHTGKVVGQDNAREIFDMIAENAWHNGDPGMIFIDEINRHEKTPHIGLVEATNPCGEQPLLPYESCNLGSINLNNMLTADRQIDWEHLKRAVKRGVRFLDNIVDLNKYPLEAIKQISHNNRRIGLGVMGWADMLYALNIAYDSTEALELARKMMQFIQSEARQASDDLASIRGPFPNCRGSKFDHPTRNSTVTTIAPTGTISMIADTSGGIEPNFSLVYVKRVMDDDRLVYVNPRMEEAAKAGGWYSPELMAKLNEGGHLQDIAGIPDRAKRVFVTAHEIPVEAHVRMQAAFQEWTDNAVSKTINMPNEATVDDVKQTYQLAYQLKCKGITIYRDGSRNVAVLNTGTSLAKKEAASAEPPVPIPATAAQTPAPVRIARESVLPAGRQHTKPRHRPARTRGFTDQIQTGDGTLYLTINEDELGLCEIFCSIGKQGGAAAAQSEALGRLISLALRSNVDPRQIVKQLKGIMGPNPVWHEGELIKSIPDAIGRAIERYLDEKESPQGELALLEADAPLPPVEFDPDPASRPSAIDMGALPVSLDKPALDYVYGVQVKESCPDCHEPLIFESGCAVCMQCGYSKCE